MLTKSTRIPEMGHSFGLPEHLAFTKEDIEHSVPERFEKVVRSYPDAIAVKTGNTVITYAQLNAAANRLARTIRSRNGNATQAVALLFENGFTLAASMLGVLKAGKFFVALDPSFPNAKIASILEDSQAELLITDQANVSLALEALRGDSRRVMEFESIDPLVSSHNVHLEISPESLAKIVYTSGSTGQPKGVVWDHRGMVHKAMLHA